MVESEDFNALYRLAQRGDPRGKYAARVSITLRDGTMFESGIVEGNINYPQQGWDEARLEQKFRWLAGHVLADARIEESLAMIRRFDQVQDVRELGTMLA